MISEHLNCSELSDVSTFENIFGQKQIFISLRVIYSSQQIAGLEVVFLFAFSIIRTMEKILDYYK
jgi:hypothetical protein